MLKYLEDSDAVKVGVIELQEQLEISEEAGVSIRQIAQQATNENGQKIPHIFREGEEEVCAASLARWYAQLKGLVELERRCRNSMQEVQVLSARQEILKSTMEDKRRLQSNGKVVRSDFLGEIRRSSANCAEKVGFVEISE